MIDYSSLIGCKVQIHRTDDDIIEGVVDMFNRTRNMLSISKAYSLKKGKYLADEMNILRDNIEKIEIVNKSGEVNDQVEQVSNESKENHVPNQKPNDCDDDENNWQSVPFSLKSKQSLAQPSQQQIRLNVKHAIDLRALPCWHFISDYDTAETILKKQFKTAKRVAFRAFTDHTRTLHANVSLICIGFEKITYIFDLASMQHEHKHDDFLDMLSFYLSEKSVRTIVFDSMFMSELFFHKYNIVISEIFDLHVAFRQQFKSIESLRIEDLIFELKPDLYLLETPNDELDWTQRPLNAEVKYKAIVETCFLLDIYEYLVDQLTSDLSRASKHCNYPLLDTQLIDVNNNKSEHKTSQKVNKLNLNEVHSPKQQENRSNFSSSLSLSKLTLCNKSIVNGFDMKENALHTENRAIGKHTESPTHNNSYSMTMKVTSSPPTTTITTMTNVNNKATCEFADDSLYKTDKYVSSQSNDYYSGKYIFVPAGYSGHKTSRKKRDILKSKSHY